MQLIKLSRYHRDEKGWNAYISRRKFSSRLSFWILNYFFSYLKKINKKLLCNILTCSAAIQSLSSFQYLHFILHIFILNIYYTVSFFCRIE